MINVFLDVNEAKVLSCCKFTKPLFTENYAFRREKLLERKIKDGKITITS